MDNHIENDNDTTRGSHGLCLQYVFTRSLDAYLPLPDAEVQSRFHLDHIISYLTNTIPTNSQTTLRLVLIIILTQSS